LSPKLHTFAQCAQDEEHVFSTHLHTPAHTSTHLYQDIHPHKTIVGGQDNWKENTRGPMSKTFTFTRLILSALVGSIVPDLSFSSSPPSSVHMFRTFSPKLPQASSFHHGQAHQALHSMFLSLHHNAPCLPCHLQVTPVWCTLVVSFLPHIHFSCCFP